MTDPTDAEIDAAMERGRITRQTEQGEAAAHFDRESGRIIVELTNGCTFAFQPRMAQGLETATDDELATVEVLGAGYGLHWEALDADLSAPGLLAGRFRTKGYMASQGGLPPSAAKAAIVEAKGGRQGKRVTAALTEGPPGGSYADGADVR